MTTTIYQRFSCRGYPAATWATTNEVLNDREIGIETDTDKFKFGDGATAWNSLSYVSTPSAVAPIEADVPSGVSLTTGTAADVAFIDLTAGTWLVTGNVSFLPAATTTMSILRAWISTTSATQPTPPNGGAFQQLALSFTAGSGQTLSAGSKIVTVASGTTRVYLGARCSFATSTMTCGGHLTATRVT